jgi:DNA-binding transcriptional ArsR family regulator
MSRVLFHPTIEQIELVRVLECLSDPIRLAIVAKLAATHGEAQELRCRDFGALGGKSNLTYHFDKLRDAGLVRTRLVGTSRYMQLRRHDLDARLPGLLDAVINSVSHATAAATPDGR